MRAPHVVLGIPAGSPEKDIRRAYRRLAKQLHPDRAAPADRAAAHVRFIELRAACDAMLAQAAKVELGAGGDAGAPSRDATFRPVGRPGDWAFGGGRVAATDRRSVRWVRWAAGFGGVAALAGVMCLAVLSTAGTEPVNGEQPNQGASSGESTSEGGLSGDDGENKAPPGGGTESEQPAGFILAEAWEAVQPGGMFGDARENAPDLFELQWSGESGKTVGGASGGGSGPANNDSQGRGKKSDQYKRPGSGR